MEAGLGDIAQTYQREGVCVPTTHQLLQSKPCPQLSGFVAIDSLTRVQEFLKTP